MPIFQEDIDHARPPIASPQRSPPQPDARLLVNDASLGSRRLSEVSLPAEFCEGPIPDSPEQRPEAPIIHNESHMIDRSVLIERLKRGGSPSWIPSPYHLDSRIQNPTSPQPSQTSPQSPGLLPSPQITPEKNQSPSPIHNPLQDGLGIERPGSALHSGDFTHDECSSASSTQDERHGKTPSRHRQDHLCTDMAWMATSPPRPSMALDRHSPFAEPGASFKSTLSSSCSSTFAYQLPTSPLAQSVTNEDQGAFTAPFRESSLLSNKMDLSRSSYDESSPFSSPLRSSRGAHGRASFRREATFPYQAHQPRRSSGSGMNFIHPGSSPQRPLTHSRRPSLGSESPSLHASMVGSYEESILQGRMSTTPSKPFDFMAQIGVLGKGKCKSRLRCPPHVTLPFPAVFYSYSNTSAARSQSNDGPSPYVGQIDLENGLPNPDVEAGKRRAVRHQAQSADMDMDLDMLLDGSLLPDDDTPNTAPLKAPPGGSYRIPEKGQIQIIVKNQNKTAVKLFLVPYDLTGMPPGTKTFVRQRSYSHGPIIDNLPNLSTSAAAIAMDRPTLRYLVHLHICSPSKGRFYLYKSIRIVFANRVPEGKEKMRNETTCPEPRFTPYKPIRQMHPPLSSSFSSRSAATLATDKARRRRSLGVPLSSEAAQRAPFSTAALGTLNTQRRLSSPRGYPGGGHTRPVEPVPFRFPAPHDDVVPGVVDDVDGPPHSSPGSRPSTSDAWGYEKLSKGKFGYGSSHVFAGGDVAGGGGLPGGGSPTEGLLSQRLRSLGVEKAAHGMPPF
ncbi:hypothetical protein CCM_02442 [Cordyceps militaris CM01]|uniref:Atos-like conserved domain-containing protein n=1 Tax=Cordyceps militaris (strain CM01) TaxID=983644 RepID=G3J9P5_CORMM|nr:uncharacterized protein CCM_02442 [Cordyceps militaris CM01]EGX94171.1 hypothetical protein CCM_02442 [Cordyceps militaris CM01]